MSTQGTTGTQQATELQNTTPRSTLSSNYKPDVNAVPDSTYGIGATPTADNPAVETPPRLQSISAVKDDTYREPKTESEELFDHVGTPKATAWEAAKVGVAPTMRDWYNSAKDKRTYKYDPNFDSKPLVDEFAEKYGLVSEDEGTRLAAAKNYEHFQHIVEQLLQKRKDNIVMSQRPWVSALAGTADIDLATILLPPVYGAARVSKGTTLAARSAQAAAGAGIALGVNSYLEDYSSRTEDERTLDAAVFALTGFFTDVSKVTGKAATASAQAPTPQQVQQALPQAVQQNLNTAQQQVLQGLTPISKQTATPTELMKKYPLLSRMTSSADELWMLTQGDQTTPVNKLLANVHTEGDNVASAQAAYLNTYGYLLAGVEQALSDAVEVSGNIFNRMTGKYQKSVQETMDSFQDSMQKLDQAVVEYAKRNNGVPPTDDQIKAMIDQLKTTEGVKRAIVTYIDSGFATKIYDDAKFNKFFDQEGMEDIIRRPTYMPLQHNYNRMHELVTSGKATWDDIYNFYGEQIVRIYPELLDPNFAKAGRTYAQVKQGAKTAKTNPYKLTVRQIGQHFVQTQRQAARGIADVTTHGMGKETMEDMLEKAGIPKADAAKAVAKIFDSKATKQSTDKHLRKRMAWDWNFKYKSPTTGEILDLGKLTGGAVMQNLDRYARRMAHLQGLARYGLTDQSLRELLESYLDKLPAGVNPDKALQFMRNVHADLTGRPTGGNVSQAIRSFQSIADMMLLVNSGLYGILDLATQIQRVGLIKSFPHFYRGLKTALGGMKRLTKDQAKDLEDILSGKLIQNTRWRAFPTHYSDNFTIDGGFNEAAAYYSQSTRFLNLSEFVKRMQIGILMGTYVRALQKAATGSATHRKLLSDKFRMPDELIEGITKEWEKHGARIDDWDAEIRIAMEQKIFHESDNLAMTIQKGEIPAVLEHDAVGKVVLPYMSFAFAMNQKVLRRVWNRDGAAGVVLLMAMQMPLAMMIAATINVRKGEDPEKDLAVGTLRAMTAFGAWNYPMELLMNGFGSNGATAITPFSKTYNLLSDAFEGELTPRSIKQNTILNAAILLDPLILAAEDVTK